MWGKKSEPQGKGPPESEVIEALRQCYDPEIPVNIYDLGLIYDLKIDVSGKVDILMTLTAPGCPVAGSLPEYIQSRVGAVPGVTEVKVTLTFDPPWTPSKMSEAAQLQLGVYPMDDSSRVTRFGI